VTRNGSRVVDPGPSLYGQFFVIYAAVECSKVGLAPNNGVGAQRVCRYSGEASYRVRGCRVKGQ
jgi:hypothetical protein